MAHQTKNSLLSYTRLNTGDTTSRGLSRAVNKEPQVARYKKIDPAIY
jgi:hypothetical protein